MATQYCTEHLRFQVYLLQAGDLCVETQSREIMAVLVHDVVADAMRLGLHGAAPPERVEKANGARFGRPLTKVRNG